MHALPASLDGKPFAFVGLWDAWKGHEHEGVYSFVRFAREASRPSAKNSNATLVVARKRRTLSPEARARIAAAQKKRWAAQKKTAKKTALFDEGALRRSRDIRQISSMSGSASRACSH